MEAIIIGILLLTSVIGLACILERGLALRAHKVIPPKILAALASCRSAEHIPMLRRLCQQHPSPLSRLLLLVDDHSHWPKSDNISALETSARHEVSRLERRLVILEIVVGIAPLLGLVGTIYGLITLFGGMGESGLGDNNALAKGIAIALNATLLGLLTAIPSLIAWSYYSKKVENFAVELAALCDRFLRAEYHESDSPERSEAEDRRSGINAP